MLEVQDFDRFVGHRAMEKFIYSGDQAEAIRKALQARGWKYWAPGVEKMVDEVCGWLRDHFYDPNRSPYLTICGNPGCGKTMLTDIIRERFDWGLNRVRDGDKIDFLRSSKVYGPDHAAIEWSGTAPDKRIMERMRHSPYFVVYDDFGADHTRMDVVEMMFLRMLEKRSKKKTIITTNLKPEEIEKQFDGRIVSRLMRNGSIIINTRIGDFAHHE